MRMRWALVVTVWVSLLVACAPNHAQRKFLPPRGWVSDFANVLDSDTQKRLGDLCQEVDQKTHAQIAVVTVQSLGDVSIEHYATSLFNEWGIGSKGDNRGVLILLATSDHQWRIEVSRGLQGLLPDQRVGEIGGKMLPDLRSGDYAKAFLGSAREIAAIIAADRKVTLATIGQSSAP